jgi:hypothetical protein
MSLQEILFDSSRAAADMAVDVIRQKPEMFDEAYGICMAQQGKMAMRAARVVQLMADQYPLLFEPYFEDLVHRLPSLTHSSVKRSMMKILTFYDYGDSEELHGIVIDTAFKWMNDFDEETAVRAYSILVLQRFTKLYPEISGELIAALQILMENAKETLSNYASRVLKDIYRDAVP